jgi:YHS domain-containing protein
MEIQEVRIMKQSRLLALLGAVAFILVLAVAAQQKSDDKAVDPVCGMTVAKAKAAATYDYKGTTYYFCSSGCKDAFAKDPDKYIQKKQQKSEDKAVDPVCGMTVVKAKAAATYEYKGTTYYFCGTGCKDAFAKDPEKYIKKSAGEKETKEAGMPMAPMMGQHMGQGPMPGQMPMGQGRGPMMGRMMAMRHAGPMGMMAGPMGPGMNRLLLRRDVEWSFAETADGVTVKIVSKDPETVKAIQRRLAMMKEMRETMAARAEAGAGAASTCSCPNCQMKEPVKK